jgi:hypothetical protein
MPWWLAVPLYLVWAALFVGRRRLAALARALSVFDKVLGQDQQAVDLLLCALGVSTF